MERVEFENTRGLTLVGDYYSAESDKAVVMAHGFKGNRRQYGKFPEVTRELNRAGFNVLAFDFSGHGESDDEIITIENEVEDLKSAVEFIKSKNIEDVGLFGLSQGGCVVLETLKEINEISCAVLLNPLTSAVPSYWSEKLDETQEANLNENGFIRWERGEGFREEYLVSEKLIEKKKNLDQDRILEDVEIPIKFIQGEKDETISPEMTRKASEKIEKASLEMIDDDHYWNDNVQKVAEISAEYFQKHMPS